MVLQTRKPTTIANRTFLKHPFQHHWKRGQGAHLAISCCRATRGWITQKWHFICNHLPNALFAATTRLWSVAASLFIYEIAKLPKFASLLIMWELICNASIKKKQNQENSSCATRDSEFAIFQWAISSCRFGRFCFPYAGIYISKGAVVPFKVSPRPRSK